MSLNNLLNKLNKVDNDIASDISEQHSPEWNMDEAFKKSLKKYHSLMKDTTVPLENENIEYEETLEFKAERITTSHRVKGVICSSCAAAICVASAIIMINIFSAPPMIDENTPEIIDNVKFPGSNSFQITTEIKERESDLTLAEQITQEEYKSEDTTEKVEKNESTIKQESAMSTSEINASIVYAPLQSEANEKANTTVKEDTTITTTINSYQVIETTNAPNSNSTLNESYNQQMKAEYDAVIENAIRNQSYNDAIKNTVSDDTLFQYLDYTMNPWMSNSDTPLTMNNRCKIEFIRVVDDQRLYSIQKSEAGGLFYSFYVNTGLQCTAYITKALFLNDYNTIKIGSSIHDVIAIEPATQAYINRNRFYAEQYGNDEFPNEFEQHIILKDGLLKITYIKSEDTYKVNKIDYFDDLKESVDFSMGSPCIYDYSIMSEDYPE